MVVDGMSSDSTLTSPRCFTVHPPVTDLARILGSTTFRPNASSWCKPATDHGGTTGVNWWGANPFASGRGLRARANSASTTSLSGRQRAAYMGHRAQFWLDRGLVLACSSLARNRVEQGRALSGQSRPYFVNRLCTWGFHRIGAMSSCAPIPVLPSRVPASGGSGPPWAQGPGP